MLSIEFMIVWCDIRDMGVDRFNVSGLMMISFVSKREAKVSNIV